MASRQRNPVHIRKPRDAFEKHVGDMGGLFNLEAEIPDVVGGTVFSHRERLEPFECSGRCEVHGMEEVALARLSP